MPLLCLFVSVVGSVVNLSVSLSGGRGCPSRDVLKVGVSLMTSLLFFPLLVWGGFVFLPFDAPLLDGPALRLVYTLRCSVFAAAPVVLGEYDTNEEEETETVSMVTVFPPLSQVGWSSALVVSGPERSALC